MSENSKVDREQLMIDLTDLCKKHNLKNGAFLAVHVESEEYVGNLAIPDPTYQAELGWRIGLALAAFNFVVLALALSSVNPRASRSATRRKSALSAWA